MSPAEAGPEFSPKHKPGPVFRQPLYNDKHSPAIVLGGSSAAQHILFRIFEASDERHPGNSRGG